MRETRETRRQAISQDDTKADEDEDAGSEMPKGEGRAPVAVRAGCGARRYTQQQLWPLALHCRLWCCCSCLEVCCRPPAGSRALPWDMCHREGAGAATCRCTVAIATVLVAAGAAVTAAL